MLSPSQLLNLQDASFIEISDFLKHAYSRGGHQVSEILDFSGAHYDLGFWGEKWFRKKYAEGAYLEFNISNENAIIDAVQPFYLYSFEKGWDEDETAMSTTPTKGSGANRGPYAIAIYSNSKDNERIATFYICDLKMFQALKRYCSR